MSSLAAKYEKEIIPALKEKFELKNRYAAPKLEKIVVNSGVGKIISTRKGKDIAQSEEELIKELIQEFSLITGQKPHIIRTKKSISGFKLRKGMISGVRATLRGMRMYDFLSRLIHIDFPRTRDFRGFEKKSVDKSGNMTIGIPEQIIFPEIPHDKVSKVWGMEVALVTTAKDHEKGFELLKLLGIPFKRY